MKGQKGITLIALIITIIVMLILAGATIAIVLGPNGVIKKGGEAANASNAAGVAEDILQGTDAESQINNVVKGGNMNITTQPANVAN